MTTGVVKVANVITSYSINYTKLYDLLDNAVRYGPEGGHVRLELRREGDAAALAVLDQGPGIPPQLRERAFESYYRIAGSSASGSGLGLAIVKEVV